MPCIQRIIRNIYDGSITFDDSGGRQAFYLDKALYASVKFLDVFITCNFSSIQFLYCNPNESWILGVGVRQKFHQRTFSHPFEPHEFALCVKQLRGRRQRWHQTNLSLHSLRYAALLDVLEVLRDLYPSNVIRKVWLAQSCGVDKCFALEGLRVFQRSENYNPTHSYEFQFPDCRHKHYFNLINLESSGVADSVVSVVASLAQTVSSSIATVVPPLDSALDSMVHNKRNTGSIYGGNRNSNNGGNGGTCNPNNRGNGEVIVTTWQIILIST